VTTATRVAGETPVTRLHRYEMWVRTVISPVLVASFPVRAGRTAVPRGSIAWVRIGGDRDVAAVVRRLAECGVDVLEIRCVERCAPAG